MSELNDVPFAKAVSSTASNYERLNYALGPANRIKAILVRKMAESLGYPMERGFVTLDGKIYNPFMMYLHSLRTLTEEEVMAISVLAETYQDILNIQTDFRLRLTRCFNRADTLDEAAYVINGLYNESRDTSDWDIRPSFKQGIKEQDLNQCANELATHLMLQGGAL